MGKFYLVIIFICIIFMSIGYSALSIDLTISGEALVQTPKNIRITDIYLKSALDGAYETYDSTFETNISNTNVTLPNQDSTITLVIEVTNNTDDYYHLDSINELLNSSFVMQYEIKDKEIIYFDSNSVTLIEITFSYKYLMGTYKEISLSLEYIFEKIPYKKLDYVVFSGDDFIDTEILNTGDYIFESEVSVAGYTNNDGGWVFSGRTNYNYTLGVFVGKYGVFNGYGSSTTSNKPNIALNTWYTLYFSRFTHTFGTQSYPVKGQVLIPSTYERTILLGGATTNWDGTVDTRHFMGKIKCFKITDAVTDEVLRYYVPAKLLSNDEIGYFDIIEDKFYSNDGTGVFGEI